MDPEWHPSLTQSHISVPTRDDISITEETVNNELALPADVLLPECRSLRTGAYMRALRRKPKSLTKRDPIKVAENRRKLREALVRNLNANVLKEEAEHSKPPEDINKNGDKNVKHPPE